MDARTAPSLRDFTISSSFDVDEADRTLARYGAAVIQGWVQEPLLSELKKDWDAVRAERLDPNSRRIQKLGGDVVDYAALYRSKPGGQEFPAIEQVFTDPRMVELCERYVGSPYLLNEEIYMTYDVGRGEEVVPSHFDKTYNLKFMIYLHDILESGRGAFSIHPGSQVLGRRRFREWFDAHATDDAVAVGSDAYYKIDNETLPSDISECVEILAPAGTMIIFGTDTFHRGGFLAEGHTRSIMRGHCAPGYGMLRSGDLIRKGSRQWLRGEQWELRQERYDRNSKDGEFELADYNKFLASQAPGAGPQADAPAESAVPQAPAGLLRRLAQRFSARAS
jgi:hypothetical protein